MARKMAKAPARRGLTGALLERARRRRLLLVALLVCFMTGLIGLGQPLENQLRIVRNLLHPQPASGDIVIVAIDDRSLAEINSWPWPRRVHAALVDRLAEAGARRIFFDIDFSSRTNAEDDRIFADALRRHSGKVVLAVHNLTDRNSGKKASVVPLPMFAPYVDTGSIVVRFDYSGVVWYVPYAAETGGEVGPSFAAKLAGIEKGPVDEFRVDYSIDPKSILRVSAADVLAGRVPESAFAGRQVIIGGVADLLGDIVLLPGKGLFGGVYVQVLGAETLKAGQPRDLGWIVSALLCAMLGFVAVTIRSRRRACLLLAGGIVALLGASVLVERAGIFMDIVPGLLLLSILTGRIGWLAVRQTAVERARTHPLSGLPTLNVLREDPDGAMLPLIVAKVTNFAEITASTPVDEQRSLVGQIAGRLALASSGRRLYQGDEGIFAWFADEETAISLEDRLGALHNLFRTPVRVGAGTIDLTIAFGVEAGSDRATQNRLGSALLAAEEAAAEGQRWKLYDAERLKEAPWRLSLLSQLEAAMDSGSLWVAYQPQLDLRTRVIIGAEALVRWTHPEKGPISPADFVPVAEASGRIRKLTEFVLDHALATAAKMDAIRPGFGMAVNLSARLIDDQDLPRLIRSLLDRYGVAPERLTLEITETAALGTTDRHLARLAELRDLGVILSIDDYGTGLSTLDYLKRVQASEIKIDRSFVMSLATSKGDKVIVESTIRLAHSLGRHVTAEGIEDEETLELLTHMDCDRAQGFFIGRPVPWTDLARLVQQEDSKITVTG
jgi:diguanylate cyclase